MKKWLALSVFALMGAWNAPALALDPAQALQAALIQLSPDRLVSAASRLALTAIEELPATVELRMAKDAPFGVIDRDSRLLIDALAHGAERLGRVELVEDLSVTAGDAWAAVADSPADLREPLVSDAIIRAVLQETLSSTGELPSQEVPQASLPGPLASADDVTGSIDAAAWAATHVQPVASEPVLPIPPFAGLIRATFQGAMSIKEPFRRAGEGIAIEAQLLAADLSARIGSSFAEPAGAPPVMPQDKGTLFEP